jgi:hypothetical protein
MSKIQSVLLSRRYFTMQQAFQWIRDHGFKAKKVDVTKNYYRFRQFNPSRLKQYRIIKPKYQKGIEFVLEL